MRLGQAARQFTEPLDGHHNDAPPPGERSPNKSAEQMRETCPYEDRSAGAWRFLEKKRSELFATQVKNRTAQMNNCNKTEKKFSNMQLQKLQPRHLTKFSVLTQYCT